MNKVRIATAVLLSCAVAAGCAKPSEKWENPSVSQSAWEVHEAECRRLARQRAEDDFALVEPGVADEIGRQSTLRTTMARYDASRQRDDLFERCMKDRGYRRAPRRPAPAQTRVR